MRESTPVVLVLSVFEAKLFMRKAKCYLRNVSFAGYFKYRERSTNLQKAADDIEHEYSAIKLGTHAYLNMPREEAMGTFANKVMSRIKEQREQQQILEQPSEATHSQIKSGS